MVTPRSPAAARLHRARWVMTALFAASTAFCLLVLAAIAVRTDSQSRGSELDNEVGRRSEGLARAVYFDAAGALHLEPLRDDGLADSAQVLAVLQQPAPGARPRAVQVRPGPASLPGQEDLDAIWGEVRHDEDTVLYTARSAGGRELQWAAAPVWDHDAIGAMMLVGIDPAPSRADHARLVRGLALGCSVLVLVAAAVGHLLSGRATRPALRGLEQQEQFLAEAAHELRTPLATLHLVLERGLSSPDRGPQALAEAVALVGRLGRLVTGLLARARVEAGSQEVELLALRLDQLVEQTVEELPDHSNVTVHTDPTVVEGDPELLAQAVRNLVENALRHGGGTPVEVTVTEGRVCVRDHGPGVPDEELTRVFERHVTAGSAAGTGTGLAIVQWVAHLHGGSAQLSAAAGGGLLAELLLPGRSG